MKFYKKTDIPFSKHSSLSNDVFMSDRYGNLCVGCYHYKRKEWLFNFYDGFFDTKSFVWFIIPDDDIDKQFN